MSKKYLPSPQEKQKYLEYLSEKNAESTVHSDENITNVIEVTVQDIMERWPGKYPEDELYTIVSDKLLFEPIEYVYQEHKQIISKERNDYLAGVDKAEDYYSELFEIFKHNSELKEAFKVEAYANYTELCLKTNIQATLETLNLFS